MNRKWIVIIICVVLLGIAFLYFRKTSASAASSASITTARVEKTSFSKIISSSGKTKADRSVELKFQSSGKLVWVGVKEGQSVAKGQFLAQLDVRDVQKNLEKSLRDYSAQRNDFDQMQKVTYNGISNPKDALTDTVKRILEKNQWSLEKAVLDVELKHLAVEYSTLMTPIAGIVTQIDTPIPGVNITPSGAVFQVIDPSSIIFEANIDETDVGQLQIGQPATIMLDAYPETTFSGKITSIAYAAETSSGGATIFPVTISFDMPDALRVGFNGDVTVETLRLQDQIQVPVTAIRDDGEGKYVFAKLKDSYVKKMVTTGPSNENVTVITSGLVPGDEVVTKGFSGVSVKP